VSKLTRASILAGILAVVIGAPGYAQPPQGPIGGQVGAPGLKDVIRHSYPLDDDHYLRWPLPPGEEAYGAIDGRRLKQYVDEITAISRKSRDDGEQYWGRISGTKYDHMAEGWVEDKFKALGLQNVHRQYFDLPPQWFPTSWQVNLSVAGRTTTLATAQPAARTIATPMDGLNLDAVWVGLGTEADFAARQVAGKAVVIYSNPTPSVINHSANYLGAIARAEAKGAAAVIVVLAIPGNLSSRLNGGAPTIPTFSLGSDDGTAIREAIERGDAKLKISLTVETRTSLRDASVWGELPGTSDENIIVMAHHDAYFEGALDNASGMATMVGLAEYFSKIPKEQRRRTIRFVTTSGHHNGSLGTRWMHDNKDVFLAKTALMINCEHVSVTQTYYWGPNLRKSDTVDARRWWVFGSKKLAELALSAYKTFGVAIYSEMEGNASGDMAQVSLDAPSVQLIESPVFYHTDHDTPDVVPAAGIEAVARAYAKLIDTANMFDMRDLSGKP
jgi:hypothetical protein